MDTTAPKYEWRRLLARCEQQRRDWIEWERSEGHEIRPDLLPTTFAPAMEAEIAREEVRLGLRLPPSVRTFYLQSNGYGTIGTYIWSVRSVGQLGWLRDVAPWLHEIIHEHEPEAARSLVISGDSDNSWWLLDPRDVDARDEWRAGRWSSSNPGMLWIARDFFGLFENEVSSSEQLLARKKSPPPPPGTGRSRNELTVGAIDSVAPLGRKIARSGYTYVPAEGFASVVTASAPLTARVGEWVLLKATRRNGPWNEIRREDVRPWEINMLEPWIFEREVAGNLSWSVDPPGTAEFNTNRVAGTECGARAVMFDAPGVYTLQGQSVFPLLVRSNVITIKVE